MPIRDEMTIDERRKYVNLMYPRYRKAKRKERSQLLSEMEQVSKLHRKHLIRLLNGRVWNARNAARREAARMGWKSSAWCCGCGRAWTTSVPSG